MFFKAMGAAVAAAALIAAGIPAVRAHGSEMMRPGDHAAAARKDMKKYKGGGNIRPIGMDADGRILNMRPMPEISSYDLPPRQDTAPVSVRPETGAGK